MHRLHRLLLEIVRYDFPPQEAFITPLGSNAHVRSSSRTNTQAWLDRGQDRSLSNRGAHAKRDKTVSRQHAAPLNDDTHRDGCFDGGTDARRDGLVI